MSLQVYSAKQLSFTVIQSDRISWFDHIRYTATGNMLGIATVHTCDLIISKLITVNTIPQCHLLADDLYHRIYSMCVTV